MSYYNNNQWCSVVYRVLDQRRLFQHTKEKFRNTKLWLLFLEHNTINRLRSKDLNVAAGLPVAVDYDCVYDSVWNSPSPFDFE